MFQLHHHNVGVVIYFCCCNIYVHSVLTASTHCCSSSFCVVAITWSWCFELLHPIVAVTYLVMLQQYVHGTSTASSYCCISSGGGELGELWGRATDGVDVLGGWRQADLVRLGGRTSSLRWDKRMDFLLWVGMCSHLYFFSSPCRGKWGHVWRLGVRTLALFSSPCGGRWGHVRRPGVRILVPRSDVQVLVVPF